MTRNEQIIRAVEIDGLTYTQAAEKFGVTRNVVAGVMGRAGIKVGWRPSSKERTEEQKKLWSDRLTNWWRERPDRMRDNAMRASLVSAAKRKSAA